MTQRQRPRISSRKQPQQERSKELVSAILQAAIQVLTQEGAARFTTARVAERAGVSVGSLYQYFPNKAAILFRLQYEEWQETTAQLKAILQNTSEAPQQRLRHLVHTFVQSECEEADMRTALNDAAPLYRDAPEARELKSSGTRTVHEFMYEALPDCDKALAEQTGDMLLATLGAAGEKFSSEPRTAEQIHTYAEAMSDMFCAYLDRLQAVATSGAS